MATRKWADDFESLSSKSLTTDTGAWADIQDLKQLDYGVRAVAGTVINAGAMVLETATSPEQLAGTEKCFEVVSLDASALGGLMTKAFQVSEGKPHGKYARWRITTNLGGTGTPKITATINGQGA